MTNGIAVDRQMNGKRYPHIIGWGIYLPEKKLCNADIPIPTDKPSNWIYTHTGILERRIAGEDETPISLGYTAARNALQMANVNPSEIDLIIVTTSSQEYLFPSISTQIQARLGATNAGAFDIVSACTGFICGLGTASAFIKSGAVDTVLIIATEILSRVINHDDPNIYILFGDGAGAVVLKSMDIPGGVYRTILHSDGNGGEFLYARIRNKQTVKRSIPDMFMDGREIFRFAPKAMVKVIKEIISDFGINIKQVDVIIPHQANVRIIQSAARMLKLPLDNFYVNIEYCGNTSTASIPIALYDALSKGRIHENDIVLLVGFGAGLTWGASLIQWTGEECL